MYPVKLLKQNWKIRRCFVIPVTILVFLAKNFVAIFQNFFITKYLKDPDIWSVVYIDWAERKKSQIFY